jgi:Flp pilus assembly protein TadG
MSERFLGAEEGQALVIVAFAMVALMGALALTLDFGYGLAGRRVAQNEADAGALAAGRLLATTFGSVAQPFDETTATQEMVWAAACNAARRNSAGGPASQSHVLGVWFSAEPATTPFSTDPTSTWTGLSSSSDDCTGGPSGTTPVSGDTVFVRVLSSATYMSLFGVATRQRIEVAGAARVRLTAAGSSGGPVVVPLAPVGDASVGIPGLGLSGYSTAPNVAIWPIVLHYEPAMWTAVGSQITLIDWDSRESPQQADTDRSAFVSFAHFSPIEQTDPANLQVHQPISESDYTGSGPLTGYYGQRHGHPQTGMLATAPGACGGNPWDTRGIPDPVQAATCDIPNWFYYGYRGSLSIGTPWNDPSWTSSFENAPQQVEMPDAFPASRSLSCGSLTSYPYFAAPSCPDRSGSSRIGDWVETVSGVNRALIASEMSAFIDRYGRILPSTGDLAVVVNVFLWDCGEHFLPGSFSDPSTRDRWRTVGGTDCSSLSTSEVRSVDRVHLFTVVPVTISKSDIDVTQRRKRSDVYITARWGDAFGPAGNCASMPTPPNCELNPLMNSAFLVPDE